MPAFAPTRKPQPREGAGFPFLQWFGRLLADGEGKRERSKDNEDFLVGEEAMKSYAFGSEGNAVFFLAGFAEDLQAIASVPWSSAALIRGHQGRDWAVLACKDARVKGSKEMNRLPLRLWFPLPSVKVDVYREVKPRTLRLRELAVVKNVTKLKDSPALVEVPLQMRGGW